MEKKLSVIVQSKGIEEATTALRALAKAASEVDKDVKGFLASQGKVVTENSKAALVSAKLQTELQKQAVLTQRLADAQQSAADRAASNAQKIIDKETKLAEAAQRRAEAEEKAAAKEAKAAQDKIQQMGRLQSQAEAMNRKFDEQRNKIDEVNKRGNVYVNTLRSMATAASAYLGVNFLKGVLEQADAWGMMQSKLSLALGSMNQAKVVQQELFNSSQQLRVPLEDMAKLYTRMAIPIQRMGRTSAETKGVVESFSTALKLAGATGQEASSAMLQFSQSMNAGRLNGGEFNSIAEAAPNVLRAIEAELIRTGRGAELASSNLKKMASEGKLSTEVLVEALLRAAPKWKKDFETLPITFDGAITRIKNAWQKAIGEVGQDTGFNKRLAEALKKIEDVLPIIAKNIGEAFIFIVDHAGKFLTILEYITAAAIVNRVGMLGVAFIEIVRTVASATTAVAGLKAGLIAVGATPIGAILSAIGAAGYYMYNVFKDLNKTTDKTIENQKAMANSGNLLVAMKEETLELMRQADAARAKIGLPAMYAKELGEVSSKYKEQKARIVETDEATKSLMEAEKKILDYKKRNKLETNYYVPANLKQELTSAQERVAAIAKVNQEAAKEAERAANAAAVADAARRGAERQKMIADAALAAKSVNEVAADARKKAYEKLKEDQEKYDLPALAVAQRKIKIERDYQEALEKTAKLKETTMPTDLWKEVTDDLAKIAEKKAKDYEKTLEGMKQENDEAERQLEILKRQLFENDSIKESKAEQAIIDAQAAVDKAIVKGIMSEEFILAQKRLDVAKETLDVTKQLETAAQVKKQAEKYENAYQAANKKIEDGLYNAIGRGSEFGIKKLIQDVKSWFARLVLSPIIQPIAQFGASIMNPNAASASTNPMDVISNIGSAFSKLMNNGSTALADTIGKAGTFFGSEFMTSVSAAMKVGGTGFTGMAATALNAMPYVAAAVAAFDGMKAINKGYQIGNMSNDVQTAIFGIAPRLFGMQDKQMTGQTVTGNLGTDNLSRNVAWSQKGGLFRSDRSGTWSYNLGNSTAIQDGKAYQDTASMASDKALLTQLNSAYEALKSSTAGLAESLGLDASKIKERTDSISFTFGKTAEETSANINKMFETVGNTIADSLLGNLKELAVVGESSYQTISRLSTSISSVNNIMKMLQMAMFQTSVDGVKAANSLVNMFGGLDNFNQASAYFVENFLTEAERMAPMVEAVNKKMSDLGYSSVTTIEGFKNLVRSLDLTNQSQASLYAELLKLAPAFKQVADSAGTVGGTLDSYTAAVDAAKTTLESALRSVASSIQGLSEKAIAAKQAEKEALNNISSGYFTAQDNVKAAQEKVIGLLRQSADAMKNFSTSIRDFVASLNGGTASGSYDALKARLNTTATLAQGGDVKSQQALTGIAQKFLEAAKSRSGSSSDYAREEARVKTLLLGVADTVDASVKAMALPEVVDPLKQANEELIAAQKSLLEYAALASTTGASTDRASQVTANSTSALLAAFMEAKANSAKAQSNLDIAQALTAQLNLPSLNEMSGFFAVLNEAYAANTALINAQAALSKSIEESVKKAGVSTEDFAKSLGLSGAEATAFTKMMSDAKLTTEGFKGLMEKTGLSASDLTIMLNSSGVSADKMALILANAGTDGEKFGDRLKAAGIPVDSFAEGLRLNGLKADSLGLIFDLSTTAAKTLEASLGNPATAATTLAGWLSTVSTTAQDLNNKFITAGGDLNNLSKALAGTGFSASDLFGLLSIAGGSATSLDTLLKTGNAENINGTAVVKALGGTITTAGYLSDLLKVTEGDAVSAKKLADSIASSNTSLVNFYSIIAGAQTSASGFNELVKTTGISAAGVLGVLGTDDDGLQGIAIASGLSLKSLIGLADQAGNTVGTLVKNLSNSGISAVSFEGIKSLTNSNASQLAGYINAASKSGETLSTDMDNLKLAANNFSSKLGLVAIPDLNSSVKESLNNFAKSIDLATGASDYVTGLLKSFTLPNAASTTTNAPTTVKSLNQQLVEDWYKTNANAIKSVDLEGIAYWTKEIEKYGVIAAKTAFAQSVAITTGTTALPINQFGSSVAPPPAPTTTSNDVLANKLTEVVSQLGLLREETKIGDLANVQATKAQTKLLNDVTDQGTALIVTSATI